MHQLLGVARGARLSVTVLFVAAVLLLTQNALAAPTAEIYRASVSRLSDNIYRDDSSSLIILTSMCLELALSDNALLNYSPGALSNKLIFSDNQSCLVTGLYKSNANLTRVDDDLYKDTNSGKYLKTRYCYAYVYYEDALVLQDSVVFLNSSQSCDLGRF